MHQLFSPTPTPDESPALQSWRERLLHSPYLRRRRVATIAAGCLVLIVAYHVVFGANGITAYAAKRHETAVLARQIQELQAENARLADHNARLKSDNNAIEQSIRAQLHFAKPDEVIVTLPDAPANPSQSPR